MLFSLLDAAAQSAQSAAQAAQSTRLDQYLSMIGDGEKLLVAIAGFVTVGLGGVFLAARKVFSQLRGVRQSVDPMSREITERDSDTLATRVDTITNNLSRLEQERVQQHADNSARLDRIEGRMDQMQDDIGGIRKVLDKILVKLAGLQ